MFEDGGECDVQNPDVGATSVAAAGDVKRTTAYTYSQLDDYLHRGAHPIVRDMSLYVYSMWVYRVEHRMWANPDDEGRRRSGRHVDVPFDETYTAARTWVQRIAVEPRIPKPEGMQFVSRADTEMHFLTKQVLLRPIYIYA